MRLFEHGPWCPECGERQAMSWLDRLCVMCAAAFELQVEASLDALARGDIDPRDAA